MRPSGPLRWACVVAIAAGALLRAPALDGGFREDDYVQQAMLDGAFPIERGPADLFWFAGRDETEGARLRDAGYLPWWSAPTLRLSMWRPLSSLLIALDHALWPDQAFVQHLHSLAWWALLVCAATLVLGRALGTTTAAIACVAYALEGAHLVPIAWLANRSTLVASSLAMLALWSHLRWRQGAARASPWVVAAFTTLALAGGEYAFSVLGYVVAYEIAARQDESWRARAGALLPVAAPSLVYLGLRGALGYGVRDSSIYVSTFDALYRSRAPGRFGALAADLAFGIPAEWASVGHLWLRLFASIGGFSPDTLKRLARIDVSHATVGLVGFASLLALYLWARGRAGDRRERLGWLVLGAAFSLVPAASALPNDRVLVGGSFGVAALVAAAITRASDRLRAGGRGRRLGPALVAALCLALHFALPARGAFVRARRFTDESDTYRLWAQMAQIPVDGIEDVHVMVVSASDFTTAANLPWVRRALGLGLPRSYRRLSGAFRPHALTLVRRDAIELEVLGDRKGLSADGLYSAAPVSAGFRTKLPGVEVEVLETHRGIPVRTRFVFDEPILGSRRHLFLRATPHGLVRVEPPANGETLQLEVASFPHLRQRALDILRRRAAGENVGLTL